MERKKWLEEIGRRIDAKDTDEFARYLTEDCTFRFGNQPAVKGRQETKDFVESFFGMISESRHLVKNFWEKENSVVWEGEVIYERLDHKKVAVNFVNIFYLRGELIKDYLIFIDNSPLFEE